MILEWKARGGGLLLYRGSESAGRGVAQRCGETEEADGQQLKAGSRSMGAMRNGDLLAVLPRLQPMIHADPSIRSLPDHSRRAGKEMRIRQARTTRKASWSMAKGLYVCSRALVRGVRGSRFLNDCRS